MNASMVDFSDCAQITKNVDLSSSTSKSPGSYDILGVVYGVGGACIVSFGLIGNLLIQYVVRHSSLKGAIGVYLSALALSDIGALISSIPFWLRLTDVRFCSQFDAFYYAHLELPVLNTFMASSIFTVVALTVERYTSVCWPGMFHTIHTTARAKLAVAISNIVALLISLPLSALKTVQEYSNHTKYLNRNCSYGFSENMEVTKSSLWTAYVWFGECFVRLVPGLVLAILNSLIIIKFRQVVKNRLQLHASSTKIKVRPLKNFDKTQAGRHLEQERRLVTLLTSIIILFFFTNIPSAVLSIIYQQDLEELYAFQVFRAVANILELSNFALNFCIYFLCSNEFRKLFFEALPHCPKKQNNLPVTRTTLVTAPADGKVSNLESTSHDAGDFV